MDNNSLLGSACGFFELAVDDKVIRHCLNIVCKHDNIRLPGVNEMLPVKLVSCDKYDGWRQSCWYSLADTVDAMTYGFTRENNFDGYLTEPFP